MQSRPHRRTARRQALDHLVIVTPGLGGSATLTFTASGALTAPAYIVGLNLSGENPNFLVTSTLTLTGTGALLPYLAGSSTLTFSATGALLDRTPIVVGEYIILQSPSPELTGSALLRLTSTPLTWVNDEWVVADPDTYQGFASVVGTNVEFDCMVGVTPRLRVVVDVSQRLTAVR